MEDSNYKWRVKKFNLYEYGVTTFVTPLISRLLVAWHVRVSTKFIPKVLTLNIVALGSNTGKGFYFNW